MTRRYATEVSQVEAAVWPRELAAKVKVVQGVLPAPDRAPLGLLNGQPPIAGTATGAQPALDEAARGAPNAPGQQQPTAGGPGPLQPTPPQDPLPPPTQNQRPNAPGGRIDLSGIRGGFTLPPMTQAAGAAGWVGSSHVLPPGQTPNPNPSGPTPDQAGTTLDQAGTTPDPAGPTPDLAVSALQKLLDAARDGVGTPAIDVSQLAALVAAQEQVQKTADLAAENAAVRGSTKANSEGRGEAGEESSR